MTRWMRENVPSVWNVMPGSLPSRNNRPIYTDINCAWAIFVTLLGQNEIILVSNCCIQLFCGSPFYHIFNGYLYVLYIFSFVPFSTGYLSFFLICKRSWYMKTLCTKYFSQFAHLLCYEMWEWLHGRSNIISHVAFQAKHFSKKFHKHLWCARLMMPSSARLR